MGVQWPLSGTIARDNNDVRAAGAKLRWYENGTTTPTTAYEDEGLAVPHDVPILADANGRWPAVFLAYGTYSIKITTSGNTLLYESDGLNFPEPSSAALSVDANSLLNTGDMFFALKDGTRTGAVRANARTMGSAASGATERANADTSTLYTYLWTNLSDTVCPVSSGRGGSAAGDFAANKTIGLPDMRGTAAIGLDTMGNSAGSRFDAAVPFSTGSATVVGSIAGLNHHVLTSAQIAAHTHTFSATTGTEAAHTHSFSGTTAAEGLHTHTAITDSGGVDHTHTYSDAQVGASNPVVSTAANQAGNTDATRTTSAASAYLHTHSLTTGSGSAHSHTYGGATLAGAAHSHSVSGTSDSTGSGTNHNNTQRSMLGTWFIRL